MWGGRPRARGSRTRPVITAQALALPPARTAAIQGPMDQCAHSPALASWQDKQMAARRRAFPSRSTAAAGAWWGGAAAAGADGLPTAQRAEAGGDRRGPARGRPPEVKNTERRRSARRCRSFCAQLLTAAVVAVASGGVGGVGMTDRRGIGRTVREFAARRVPRGVVRACMATGEEPSGLGAVRYRCSCVMCWLWPRAARGALA